jgi:hypothetical protein
MTAPALTRRIIEALLEEWLPHSKGRRLLLVYGRYTDGTAEFATTGAARVRAHIRDEHSVLGITEAWQGHLSGHPDDTDVLVVATTVDDRQLGWDLRAHAIARSTQTVDRAKIVAQRFGSVDVDPRLRTETWLVDALLDAEPAEGWPRNGSVLTRDAAIRALIGARLGGVTVREGSLDAAALLAWSRDPAGPDRFAALPEPERQGLGQWLTDTVGETAAVVLRLATARRAGDVVPLGVVSALVTEPAVTSEALVALGGLAGGVRQSALYGLAEAVAATLWRWVEEARSGSAATRTRVFDILKRAEQLAAEAGLTAALSANRFLPSAFDARLHRLAETTSASDRHGAEQALDDLREHCVARLSPSRARTAEMAVRLTRWLATPAGELASVASGITGYNDSLAWVDRALTVLWEGDARATPAVSRVYREVCEAVRERRTALDEDFAQRLAVWTRTASDQNPGGVLLIEQVLATLAVPLAGGGAPMVVVLDGMSGAAAADLGEELSGERWLEAAPGTSRSAAVSAIPSVTRVSRASLLTGTLAVGEQQTEKDGFTKFWRRYRKHAELFHRGDIAGQAGHRLSDALMTTLSGDAVVGVVLNTIDHALDHGREGDRTGWSVSDVTFLPELLDAAFGYGRPVLLVSDHGHVLDRFPDIGPVAAPGAESARWRTGTPEPGEVALAGPRVGEGGGAVVVPWRDDIRYTQRRSGYHGGASLSEMTVPALAFVPSVEHLPDGWRLLTADMVVPPWWEPASAKTTPVVEVAEAPARSRKRKGAEPEGMVPLFGEPPAPGKAAPRPTVGAVVVASDTYEVQRAFVPKPPNKEIVAAVIDALVDADGVLPLSTVATVAGRAARRPEFFAVTLERLLNVDQYPVVSLVDGDRRLKLDIELLRSQFKVVDP